MPEFVLSLNPIDHAALIEVVGDDPTGRIEIVADPAVEQKFVLFTSLNHPDMPSQTFSLIEFDPKMVGIIQGSLGRADNRAGLVAWGGTDEDFEFETYKSLATKTNAELMAYAFRYAEAVEIARLLGRGIEPDGTIVTQEIEDELTAEGRNAWNNSGDV